MYFFQSVSFQRVFLQNFTKLFVKTVFYQNVFFPNCIFEVVTVLRIFWALKFYFYSHYFIILAFLLWQNFMVSVPPAKMVYHHLFSFLSFGKKWEVLVLSATTCGRQLPTNHPVAALATRVAKCISPNGWIYFLKLSEYICSN